MTAQTWEKKTAGKMHNITKFDGDADRIGKFL